MFTHSDDSGIQVAFQGRQRPFRILGVPDGRRRHAKYLWAFGVMDLKVFAHYSVVGVVLARVMTLIKD